MVQFLNYSTIGSFNLYFFISFPFNEVSRKTTYTVGMLVDLLPTYEVNFDIVGFKFTLLANLIIIN